MPRNWSDLDDYKRERVAARLVATIFFPPQLSGTKNAEEVEKKNKKSRKRAARTFLTHEFAARVDALMLLGTLDDLSFQMIKDAFLSSFRVWRPGWINELAPRLNYFDRTVPRRRWEAFCNLYLVALAKIRLKQAGQPHSLMRSISLVIKTRKSGAMETTIENTKAAYKTVWPMVCAAVQLLGEVRGFIPTTPGASMHTLIEGPPPTSRELIRIIIDDPGRYFAACRYFLDELSARSGQKQQPEPPLPPDQCFKWPIFSDLDSVFVPSDVLYAMSPEEESVTAKHKYTDYKRGNPKKRQHRL
ncbi:MAG: hypothetical protein QOJ86_2074 [Bradyrhizobium sp.]|nr:hypothetical protein [Bradyrhizobium sp.]